MKFRTRLTLFGKTATGFEVPAKVVAALGTSKKPAVKATINGFAYRSTVAVMGGKFLVGVSAERREGAGVKAGDMLDVDLQLDTEPRELAIPKDLTAALAKEAKARKAFEALSYSGKQGFVVSIEGAKTEETRARRVAKTIEAMRALPAKKK